MNQKLEFRVPTLNEISAFTRKRSAERQALSEIYGKPFNFLRFPVYNNSNFKPDSPVVGSVRAILDDPKRGIRISDVLIAHQNVAPLDAVLERIMDFPLDTDLIQRVYERLSTSRILAGEIVCAGVEVITGMDDPHRVSSASIVYPVCYENGESPFAAPAYVGSQMALLYLHNFK